MSMSTRSTIHPQPTPYADLNAVLRELITRVQNALGANFIGAYLQGSFAIGDFDAYSDVDFLVVVEEDIAGAQLPILQRSEEHTSELQSRGHLVCRLLLEKKKTYSARQS